MKLTRREFLIIPLVLLLEKRLSAESNNFSDLNDNEKKEILFEIVKEMDEKYVFPVPMASDLEKKQALSVNKTLFEFGAGRPYNQRHKGIDVYGFGKDIVYFADGEVEEVGRNINNFDHGNIVVVNHGIIKGYNLWSYYLHIGGINGIKRGDSVKMGESFAKVDCTGISPDSRRLYNPGSKNCKRVAHLHFQIRVGDRHVNPNYFFPEYSESSLPNLKRWRLALKASSLEDDIAGFKGKQSRGSF